MIGTSICLYYLENYANRNQSLHFEDSLATNPMEDYTLIFYTLLLAIRITLVLTAVYIASRYQSTQLQPNFWLVFLAFLFPIPYFVLHFIMGWQRQKQQ
jgi:hypothetical protein